MRENIRGRRWKNKENDMRVEKRGRERRRVVTVRKGNDKELADENEEGE